MLTDDEAARITLKILTSGPSTVTLEEYLDLMDFLKTVGEDDLEDLR